MDELLDKDAKSELESELCINWSEEVKPPYKLKMFCGSGMFIPDPNFFNPGSRISELRACYLRSRINNKKRREEKLVVLVLFFVAHKFYSIDRIFSILNPKKLLQSSLKI